MDLNEATRFARKKFKDKGIASASLDAEVLLLEALRHTHRKIAHDKNWLYLNLNTYKLSEKEEAAFRSFINRRLKSEPVAYILGRKEFFGLDFHVDRNVLIPRSDSELLVEKALEAIKASDKGSTLIDIGTGSGCIPIAIIKTLEAAGDDQCIKQVFADDISEDALRIARKNARVHAVSERIKFIHSDLEKALERLPKGEDVIITANLPYIAPSQYPLLGRNVRLFEPKIALTAPQEGLYHIRRLIEKMAFLESGFRTYRILLEADPKQMKSIGNMAKKNLKGCEVETFRDLRHKKRVLMITAIRPR